MPPTSPVDVRLQFGMASAFASESCPASRRNRVRLHVGNTVRHLSESSSIREWPRDKLANTALATVLSNTPSNVLGDDHVNIMLPGKRGMLTDHQLDAAEAALEQGLT